MCRGTGLFSTKAPFPEPGVPAARGGALAPGRAHLWKTGPSPSVSVGNLAMGGRGKTPVVAEIARRLVAAGQRPAILSRGYKRRRPEDGVVVVSDGVHLLADLDRSGDEPLMLARAVPGAAVLVCEVRSLAAALATRALGATVLLLDDGFQHTAMRRDVDIVIVTPADLHDRRLPFGRLRSSVGELRRADVILIDDPNAADGAAAAMRDALATRYAGARVFSLRRALGAPEPLEPARGWPDSRGPVVAVAGIASPQRFTRSLETAGWTVTETLAFPDHHAFTPRDVRRIADAVARTGAGAAVTTAKDAVRLLPLRPLPVPMAAIPLRIAFDPAGAFDEWLASLIAGAGR